MQVFWKVNSKEDRGRANG